MWYKYRSENENHYQQSNDNRTLVYYYTFCQFLPYIHIHFREKVKEIEHHRVLMKRPNPISLAIRKFYSHLFSNLVRTFRGSNDKGSKWKGKNSIHPLVRFERNLAKVKSYCFTFYDIPDLDYDDDKFCFFSPMLELLLVVNMDWDVGIK